MITNIETCAAQEGLTIHSPNLLELVISGSPYRVDLAHYRGDRFGLSVVGRNFDDTPFDFAAVLIAANTHFKIHSVTRSPIASFSPDEHFLGQSQMAIDFDLEYGNPPGTTKDELHIVEPSGKVLDVVFTQLVYDVELTLAGNEPRTLMAGALHLRQDVTRIAAENGAAP